jgi:hypothetical protein
MVIDLTMAGIVEARLWQSAVPWLDSVRAARPFWITRTYAAIPITAGFIAFLVGLTTGPKGAGLAAVEDSVGLEAVDEITPRLTLDPAQAPGAAS